jgi:formylglycine-generating enzyme required for sulfatase activity
MSLTIQRGVIYEFAMDTFQECEQCPEMVVVAAGSFLMGSPANEPERKREEGPQHRVTVAR